MLDRVTFAGKTMVRNLVVQCHYSAVMPRITKACIGGWQGERLVAGMTLGYGTRPLHTLKGMFPSLEVPQYLEIGKLCVRDEMPRNTESYFIARAIRLISEQMPEVVILFSWADGILGKPGYVYQASNFYYGSFINTEIYLNADGVKIHPRTVQGLTAARGEVRGPRDYETTRALGLTKYFGKQFRYVYPLCDKRAWQALSSESPLTWERSNYPKDVDCTWEVQTELGKREACGMPPFVCGDYVKDVQGNQGRLFEAYRGLGSAVSTELRRQEEET